MVPIVRHADVRRMLLAQKAYAEGALALVLYCGRLEANSLAIQVHGGYGYTREYDVEQHYRDNRLNPIHEGTHGIQAIDLLGREVVMGGGAGFRALREVIGATVERAADAGGEAAMLAAALRDRLGRLVDVTAALAAHPDAEERLAGASLYLEAAGHVVVAWIWLEQFLAAAERDDDLVPRISWPALVIMGTEDPDWADPRAEAEGIIAAMPAGLGASAMINGAGHYPHAQRPDEVAALTTSFLRKRVLA